MADLVNAPDEGNAAEVTKPEESIPEQFRGKSETELVTMYQHLEKKLGEQSEELGSLRALAESAVAPSVDAPEIDFYDNPEAAIERIIERKLAPVSEQVKVQKQSEIRAKLDQNFPDWQDTSKSTDFQEWVAASPVRVNLWNEVNALSYDAASELLSNWQAINGSKADTEKQTAKAVQRDRKLRAAATEKGSSGVDPKKILNRADLRTLRQTNPTRYNELLPDIRRAYAEGRVR